MREEEESFGWFWCDIVTGQRGFYPFDYLLLLLSPFYLRFLDCTLAFPVKSIQIFTYFYICSLLFPYHSPVPNKLVSELPILGVMVMNNGLGSVEIREDEIQASFWEALWRQMEEVMRTVMNTMMEQFDLVREAIRDLTTKLKKNEESGSELSFGLQGSDERGKPMLSTDERVEEIGAEDEGGDDSDLVEDDEDRSEIAEPRCTWKRS